MRRNDLMAKRLKEKEQWENEQLLKKAEELGLGYQQFEIPDEEKVADASILHSLMAMIPYTQAYYEANASEQEMDDLAKIRIEKAKANDFLALAQIPGKHDEALEKMLSETNNDFFYFNALKFKLENEGKYKYKEKDLNPFKDIGSKKNRLRKAIRMQFDIVMRTDAVNLNATVDNANDADANKKKLRALRSQPCCWRGKSKAGDFLQCLNGRFLHPHQIYKDENGKEQHEALSTCAYHATACVGEHPADQPQKILTPNPDALCTECYIDANQGAKPAACSLEKAPGVAPLSAMVNLRAANMDTKAVESELSDDSLCNWQASEHDENGKGYKCISKVYRDPESKMLYPTCAYHIKHCIRKHTSDANDMVEISNKYGLCSMHHMAEHQELPIPIPFPLPGVVRKKFKRVAAFFKPSHFLAPNWPPLRDVRLAVYNKPVYDDIIQMIFASVNRTKRWVNKLRYGKKVVILIQRVWRGFCCRKVHIKLRFQKGIMKRRLAVVRMQSFGRRYLAYNRVKELRQRYIDTAILIQRIYRGYIARYIIKRLNAAKRIQRFCKRYRIVKFQDSVIMVMQIKRSIRGRIGKIKLIQRIVRGYLGRYFVFRKKLYNFIRRRNCQLIKKAYRAYLKRKTIVYFTYPPEEWVMDNCGRRIAMMLWDMISDRKQRYLLEGYMKQCAVPVQRLVRGFIARKGFKMLKYLRKALQSWCKPEYANEFFRLALENKSLYMQKSKPILRKTMSSLSDVANTKLQVLMKECREDRKSGIIRKFLPVAFTTVDEIDPRIVLPTLKNWYHYIGAPSLPSELDALMKQFRNPIDNTINITEMDDYVSLHNLPCRIHGRTICGDCIFIRECKKYKCKCKRFTGMAGAACLTCVHPLFCHRKCPVQLRKDAENDIDGKIVGALKCALDSIRIPDLSVPESVKGVRAEDIMIKPPDPMAIYLSTIERDTKLYETRVMKMSMKPTTLTRELAMTTLDGKLMETHNPYWDLREINTIRAEDVGVQGIDISTYSVIPTYDIPATQFWSEVVAKNPNKSIRQYDENFEHNIPFPIVQNRKLVFTFEGPKLYVNILVQICKWEKISNLWDYPDFLRLICDHIQLFERHWRKMVADIREGKLNHRVMIDANARQIYESTSIARPRLAEKLDETFRKLGFHNKALGKDIEIKPYAERKEGFVLSKTAAPMRRSTPGSPCRRDPKGLGSALEKAQSPSKGMSSPLRQSTLGDTTVKPEAFGNTGQVNRPLLLSSSSKQVSERQYERQLTEGHSLTRQSTGLAKLTTAQNRMGTAANNRINTATTKTALSTTALVRINTGTIDASSLKTVVSIEPLVANVRRPSEPALARTLLKSGLVRANSGVLDGILSSATGFGMSALPTCVPCKDDSDLRSSKQFSRQKRVSIRENSMTDASAALIDWKVNNSPPRVRLADKADVLKSMGSAVTGGGELGRLKDVTLVKELGGPNRRAPGDKRRGSDTDVLHPTSMVELGSAYYGHDTAARGSMHEILKVTEGSRFVCPFPACGMSFPSKEAAFVHIPEHEQKLRLAAPTPLPDSHMHFYWPEGAPWVEEKKYTDRTLPPGSIACSFLGCLAIFPDKARLDVHKRLVHNEYDLSHIKKGYFVCDGHGITVPPFEAPDESPIKYCPNHITSSGKCMICIDVENSYGPKPPVRFYDMITYNFQGHRDIIAKREELYDASHYDKNNLTIKQLSPLDAAMLDRFPHGEYNYKTEISQILYNRFEYSYGMYVSTSYSKVVDVLETRKTKYNMISPKRKKANEKKKVDKRKVIWQGRPIAIALDKSDVGWVCLELLFTYNQLELALGLDLCQEIIPRDIDKKYELIIGTKTLLDQFQEDPVYTRDCVDSVNGVVCRWVKVYDVVGKFTLRRMECDAFKNAMKNKLVPSKNSYFTRPIPIM